MRSNGKKTPEFRGCRGDEAAARQAGAGADGSPSQGVSLGVRKRSLGFGVSLGAWEAVILD